jgi:hypothetical protein
MTRFKGIKGVVLSFRVVWDATLRLPATPSLENDSATILQNVGDACKTTQTASHHGRIESSEIYTYITADTIATDEAARVFLFKCTIV